MRSCYRLPAFLLLLGWGLLLVSPASAQTIPPPDKSRRVSPLATAAGPGFVIEYSRPSMKGRKVFGGLVSYGQVWRTGANEATTFEAKQAVKINGQDLPAGKYALFTIPGEREWVLIFNKVAQQLGAFKYDAQQDALRVKSKPAKTAQPVEQFTISATKTGLVTLAWENTQATFTVSK